MTPRQYYILMDRHRERERHTQYLTGVLAAAIGNWSMGRPEQPLKPSDFALPLLQDRAKITRVRRWPTKKQLADKWRAGLDSLMKRQPKPTA